MSADLWDQCAAVIARTERAVVGATLNRTDLDLLADQIAADLLQSIPGLTAVRISICSSDDDSAEQPLRLAQRGPWPDPASLNCFSRSSSSTTVLIEIGGAENLTSSDAVSDTATALAGLVDEVFQRTKLVHLESLIDSLSLASSPEQRSHLVAKAVGDWMGADRFSLVSLSERRLFGSSVQCSIDPRARLVVALEKLAGEVKDALPSDSVFQHISDLGERDHVDEESGLSKQSYAGLLNDDVVAIAESFSGDRRLITSIDTSLLNLSRVELTHLSETSGASLRRGVFKRWNSVAWRVRLALIAAVIALLSFWPMTIQVTATGRLLPKKAERVFARADGELEKLHCESGDQVKAGQLLLELTSPDWESQHAELTGELLTAKEQLQIVIATRGDVRSDDIAWQRPVLEARIRSLGEQLQLVEERQQALNVHSSIDGVVELFFEENVGDDPGAVPVRGGQPILRVVDPIAGYWVQLDLPDSQIGYILSAKRQDPNDTLGCRYRIRSLPGMDHQGKLVSLEASATATDAGQLVVRAKVQSEGTVERWKPETGVNAWVQCGKASMGFVLFRRVIETVRLWGW